MISICSHTAIKLSSQKLYYSLQWVCQQTFLCHPLTLSHLTLAVLQTCWPSLVVEIWLLQWHFFLSWSLRVPSGEACGRWPLTECTGCGKLSTSCKCGHQILSRPHIPRSELSSLFSCPMQKPAATIRAMCNATDNSILTPQFLHASLQELKMVVKRWNSLPVVF